MSKCAGGPPHEVTPPQDVVGDCVVGRTRVSSQLQQGLFSIGTAAAGRGLTCPEGVVVHRDAAVPGVLDEILGDDVLATLWLVTGQDRAGG